MVWPLLLTLINLGPVEGVVKRPDVDLHYRVYGDRGPTVIILSGGPGGSIEMLRPVCNHLQDRFRCVMLEQRGTGRSRLAKYDETTVNFDAYIADVEAVRKHSSSRTR
jgi:proline iminopeptidase